MYVNEQKYLPIPFPVFVYAEPEAFVFTERNIIRKSQWWYIYPSEYSRYSRGGKEGTVFLMRQAGK